MTDQEAILDEACGGAEAPDILKPFDEEAQELYDDIMLHFYEGRVAEMLPEYLKKEAREILLEQVMFHEKFNDGDEEEETETANELIDDLIREHRATTTNRDIIHLFISAPKGEKDHQKRTEEFQAYCNLNSCVSQGGSNATTIKVTQKGSVCSVIKHFIRESSRFQNVKRLSVVINGHGSSKGELKLLGRNKWGEKVIPNEIEYLHVDTIVENLDEFLKNKTAQNWPKVTIVFAQCHAHKIRKVDIPFEVVWFTTRENPRTQSRKIGGVWNHLQLNTYGREQPQETVLSMSSWLKNKWLIEVCETSDAAQLRVGVDRSLTKSEGSNQLLLLSLIRRDGQEKDQLDAYFSFAQMYPGISAMPVIFTVENAMDLLSTITEFIGQSIESPVTKHITVVMNGIGQKTGQLLMRTFPHCITNDDVIRHLLMLLKNKTVCTMPNIALVIAQNYGHIFDENLATQDDSLEVMGLTDVKNPKSRQFRFRDQEKWHHEQLREYAIGIRLLRVLQ